MDLARDAGLTDASISRIINGVSRPRQVTISRIMEHLCSSRDEQQLILRAYSADEKNLPEEDFLDDETNAKVQRERCERYLEMKAQSIAFKRSVAKELDKAGIEYKQDYCEGIYVTDFFIERNKKRIAIECKFNVHRDFEKTVTIAELLREHLYCHRVIVVVPYEQNESGLPETSEAELTTVSELIKTIEQA